jgi:hypothetical protein
MAGGSPAERAAARTRRIEKLHHLLEGGPARRHPRPGRTLDRRDALEMSLRRAKIVARQDLLRRVGSEAEHLHCLLEALKSSLAASGVEPPPRLSLLSSRRIPEGD